MDIVGLKDKHEIGIAFCSNPAIELEDVKKLDRVPCEKKFVISFSQNRKKVELSSFYLKPGIEHIYIFEGQSYEGWFESPVPISRSERIEELRYASLFAEGLFQSGAEQRECLNFRVVLTARGTDPGTPIC